MEDLEKGRCGTYYTCTGDVLVLCMTCSVHGVLYIKIFLSFVRRVLYVQIHF